MDVKRGLRKLLPFHCWNYSKQTATQQIRQPEQLAPFMQISVKNLMRNTAISYYFHKKTEGLHGIGCYHSPYLDTDLQIVFTVTQQKNKLETV